MIAGVLTLGDLLPLHLYSLVAAVMALTLGLLPFHSLNTAGRGWVPGVALVTGLALLALAGARAEQYPRFNSLAASRPGTGILIHPGRPDRPLYQPVLCPGQHPGPPDSLHSRRRAANRPSGPQPDGAVVASVRRAACGRH